MLRASLKCTEATGQHTLNYFQNGFLNYKISMSDECIADNSATKVCNTPQYSLE